MNTRGHDIQRTRGWVNEICTLQEIANEARDRVVNGRMEYMEKHMENLPTVLHEFYKIA